jgi:hypothetical protein
MSNFLTHFLICLGFWPMVPFQDSFQSLGSEAIFVAEKPNGSFQTTSTE